MGRKRIKVCGITRLEDAIAACELGVDALGFVFYNKSPRYVSAGSARQILNKLPPFVSTVGLFVDPEPQEVNRHLDSLPLDILQFHGNESEDFCNQFSRPYIKAIGVKEAGDVIRGLEAYTTAKALLLDVHDPVNKGGTGKTFDWNLLPDKSELPLILAGGLTPGNARAAAGITQVYALDVSSGVEAQKGIKDPEKISAFVKEVSSDQQY